MRGPLKQSSPQRKKVKGAFWVVASYKGLSGELDIGNPMLLPAVPNFS